MPKRVVKYNSKTSISKHTKKKALTIIPPALGTNLEELPPLEIMVRNDHFDHRIKKYAFKNEYIWI